MSDKKNISIQDRGWNEMRAILDKELPEKKRKRRFGFWIFLWGAAVMASILLMFNILSQPKEQMVASVEASTTEIEKSGTISNTSQKQEISPESEESNSKPIQTIQKVPESVTTTTNRVEGYHKIANENPSKINESNSTSTQVAKAQAQNRKQEAFELIKNPSNVSVVQQKTLAADVSTAESNALEIELKNVEIREKTVVPNLGPVKSNERTKPKRDLLIPFMTIPFEKTKNIDSEKIFATLDKPFIKITRNNYFTPYAFTAGSFQPNISGLGYGMGAGISYGNANSSFYFELAYFKTSMNNSSDESDLRELIPAIEDDGMINSDQGSFEGGETENLPEANNIPAFSVPNLSKITASADEFKFDFGIRKQLFRNLSLDVGIAYSRIIRVTNQRAQVEIVEPLTSQSSFYNLTKSQFEDFGAYSNYDFIPHFGLDYRVSSTISLNFNFNYGLINLIRNEDFEEFTQLNEEDALFRRNVGLKIRYEF
ncbi:MAG: hypothetical protein AAGA77_15930 [Bacteroidota bacterium]